MASSSSSSSSGGDQQQAIVVIGAGITGMAAAHRAWELNPTAQLHVLEAGNTPGGVLQTVHRDGYVLETSADSFITNVPYGLDLCRRVGLEDKVIPTDSQHRRAFVVRRGRLEPIPDGLMIMAPSKLRPMMTTRILSPTGKARMAGEWLVAKGHGGDESLASFARRRFGREAYERLIQPMVGGMYTGDPEQLSVLATMPRFVEMEQQHGSLIQAMRNARKRDASSNNNKSEQGSGARYGLFVGVEGGLSELIHALARRLPETALQCDSPALALSRDPDSRWQVQVGGSHPRAITADAVILATPARVAAGLLSPLNHELASLIGAIPTTSCAVVSLAYHRDQVAHPLDGFGFVVPNVEGREILSGSFSSVKFTGRAPAGQVLLRAFLGGSQRPELVEASDDDLVRISARELGELLGIKGDPHLTLVARWRGSMPQYHVGHLQRVSKIEELAAQSLPGLALAGNAYRGVGVPFCIKSGEQAAEHLSDRRNQP